MTADATLARLYDLLSTVTLADIAATNDQTVRPAGDSGDWYRAGMFQGIRLALDLVRQALDEGEA